MGAPASKGSRVELIQNCGAFDGILPIGVSVVQSPDTNGLRTAQSRESIELHVRSWAEAMIAANHPVRLTHIPQRTSCDCGVAIAATVANIPYELAAQCSPVPAGKRPMFSREMLKLLNRATHVRWRGPCITWFHRFESLAESGHTLVLTIRRGRRFLCWPWKMSHYIAVRDGLVYDPEYAEPILFPAYARRDWSLLEYYCPRDPDRLLAVQKFNGSAQRQVRLGDRIFGE